MYKKTSTIIQQIKKENPENAKLTTVASNF